MDTLGPDLLVWAFMFILVFEGAHGSIQDACKGRCVNLEGYFCEPFNGICEPCQHCRTGDENGCRAVCDAWNALKTTPSSTPEISSTTPSFLAQTTMSAQINATSMNNGISPIGGDLSSAGTSSPMEMTDSIWLWLGILVAGIVSMIAVYHCCQHLRKKRKRNNRNQGDEEIGQGDMELQQLPPPRREELAPRCEDPLLPNPVPVDNNKCPRQQLSSREDVGAEAPESGYDSQPGTIHGSSSVISGPGSLHSSNRPVEVVQYQRAVPTCIGNPGGETQYSLTVQDGSHGPHAYALP